MVCRQVYLEYIQNNHWLYIFILKDYAVFAVDFFDCQNNGYEYPAFRMLDLKWLPVLCSSHSECSYITACLNDVIYQVDCLH